MDQGYKLILQNQEILIIYYLKFFKAQEYNIYF